MKKIAAATLFAMTMALPTFAQTMDTMLPSLTWPDATITPSTKGCAATSTPSVCTPQK